MWHLDLFFNYAYFLSIWHHQINYCRLNLTVILSLFFTYIKIPVCASKNFMKNADNLNISLNIIYLNIILYFTISVFALK